MNNNFTTIMFITLNYFQTLQILLKLKKKINYLTENYIISETAYTCLLKTKKKKKKINPNMLNNINFDIKVEFI